MKKKLFLIGISIVVLCMAAGCRKAADKSKDNKNSTEATKSESRNLTEKIEQKPIINEEIIEKLIFEKKTFPGVKDERDIPEETGSCPLHIEDFKRDGEYLYIADCSGGLYAFQWKKEKLELLLRNEEYSYHIMRDMNGKLYVTDNQKNNIKAVYGLQGGKLEKIAKIDSHYTMITMDKDYLYVQESKGEEIKQIKINTPDKIENGTNPIVKNLSAFFEKYHTEDYSIQNWEYEKDNWYVHLVNWKNDNDELYKIDKSGKSEIMANSSNIAFAGVRQGKVYVSMSAEEISESSENANSIDEVSDEKIYCIDEKGNRALYFNLSKVKQLDENGFNVHSGEWGENEWILLKEGPDSQMIIYDEEENKMICFSKWEKQE